MTYGAPPHTNNIHLRGELRVDNQAWVGHLIEGKPRYDARRAGVAPGRAGASNGSLLQSAMNSSSTNGGGVFILEQGAYNFDAFTIPRYVYVICQGRQATQLTHTNTSNNSFVTVGGTGSGNTGIYCGLIGCQLIAGASTTNLLYSNGLNYSVIGDILLDGNDTAATVGVSLYGSVNFGIYYNTFHNIRVTDCAKGYVLNSVSTTPLIAANKFSVIQADSCTGDAFTATSIADNQFDTMALENNWGWGMTLGTNVKRNHFFNLYHEHNGRYANFTTWAGRTTISFDETGGVYTVSDSANGLAMFATGDVIVIEGSASNNGTFTVASGGVAGSFTTTETLVDEAAGAAVIIYKKYAINMSTAASCSDNVFLFAYSDIALASPANLRGDSTGANRYNDFRGRNEWHFGEIIYLYSQFAIRRPNAADDAINIRDADDANDRFVLSADGSMFWGPGSASTDTALGRQGANLLGTASGDNFYIGGDQLRIANSKTPASATAAGTHGSICWDGSFLYVCTATNTWVRAALSTW